MNINDDLHHVELMCKVDKLEYDYAARVGKLYVPALNCTDMKGAIQVFEAIDQDVISIQVFADNVPDMLYFFNGGKWQSQSMR